MVIGIAGKYCSGKNSVISPLESRGFYHIDVDKLGHKALKARKEELIKIFGKGIEKEDGSIDRKALGSIVFSSPEMRKKLEGVVHPEMVRMTEEIIKEKNCDIIINAAILFEMKLDRLCDFVIWVEAPFFFRVVRGMKRDSLSLPAVLKRIWTQRKMDPNKVFSNADIYIVKNRGNRRQTAKKIEDILLTRK